MYKKLKRKKFKITKKTVVIVCLLILTGLVGWFAPILITSYSRSVEQAQQKQFESKREEAQNLRVFGKTEEAIAKADEALKDSSLTDDQRYRLYIERGNIPFDKGDYIAAIEYYEKAEQIRQDYQIVELLDISWDYAGNSEKAIEYYKLAIKLMPEDSPMRSDRTADIEKAIRRLGGTP